MVSKKIEKLTSSILKELGFKSLPIPVEQVAIKRGLEVKSHDLGEQSGVLILHDGRGTIGYNIRESKVRQRFTIAHELGHFELHRHETDSGLFIDDNFKVEFRNYQSSTGMVKTEQEANAFAASLLMPEDLLRKEITKHHYDLSDDNSLKELAKKFNVSFSAMSFRIINLHLND